MPSFSSKMVSLRILVTVIPSMASPRPKIFPLTMTRVACAVELITPETE